MKTAKYLGFSLGFLFFLLAPSARASYVVDIGSQMPNFNIDHYKSIESFQNYATSTYGIQLRNDNADWSMQTIEAYLAKTASSTSGTFNWQLWTGNNKPEVFVAKTGDYNINDLPSRQNLINDTTNTSFSYFQFSLPQSFSEDEDVYLLIHINEVGDNNNLIQWFFDQFDHSRFDIVVQDLALDASNYDVKVNWWINDGLGIKIGDENEINHGQSVTIDTPIENDPAIFYMLPGASFTISGFCPENGAAKVAVNTNTFTTTQKVDPDTYSFTCSGNNYSVTATVPSQSRFTIEVCALYTENEDTYYTCADASEIVMSLGSTVYNLSVRWPTGYTAGYYWQTYVHAGAVSMRIFAQIPNNATSTSQVRLWTADSSYATSTLVSLQGFPTIPFLDYMSSPGENLTAGDVAYYVLGLYDNGVMKRLLYLKFSAKEGEGYEYGDTKPSTNILPVIPSNDNPTMGDVRETGDCLSDYGSSWCKVCRKVPFNYICDFVQVSNELLSTTTEGELASLDLTLPGNSLIRMNTTSISFVRMDSIYRILPVGTWNFLRGMMSAAIVITTFLYCFNRIQNILTHGY